MKTTNFLFCTNLLVLLAAGNAGVAQSRLSLKSVTTAMNARNNVYVQVAPSGNSNSGSSLYVNSNINAIQIALTPPYNTSVQVYYGIPGSILFDWINIHNSALSLLSYGPGQGDNTNYLNSDIGALNYLAYTPFVNPSAYGQRTLQFNVQQWTGNLNSYSDDAGGGRNIRNYYSWFMRIQGKLMMKIN